ncbi:MULTISPECIES: hypothetical protein [Actinomadura]|uniref:Uncharacterized protein n=1 Tax=Actinomadura yumaensis TaxID=111807 RepID=A0ABW2CL30_9ACTN|nr:hypothetical protein [Actinomadura sp. J1-007]MWK37800.1 hypothetical protein [Actinomadura sp. J1-007]
MKFAQCMRENGINVPDPGSGADPKTMRLGKEGTDRKKLEAAMEKCQGYLQAGGKMPDLKDPKMRDQYTKLAQCMRENGVNMPDPGPDGRLRLPEVEAGGRDKAMKAREKCKRFVPGEGR